jgi:hypothetical protein
VAADATAELTLPPSEPATEQAEFTVVQPRLFGVTPPTFLFALAAVALTLGVVFAVLAQWLACGLAIAAAAVLAIAFVEVARRKPDTAATRASAEALGTLRSRAGYAVEQVSVRRRAALDIRRRRVELLRLSSERDERLRELGEAVYRADRDGEAAARRRIGSLDERIAQLEAEIRSVASEADERLARARLQVAPTEQVETPEPPAPEPEPAPSPEPFEPPPAPREPYPPPDEATPPEPARVPEPGPLDRLRGRIVGKK